MKTTLTIYQGLSPKGLCLTFYPRNKQERLEAKKLIKEMRQEHDIDHVQIMSEQDQKQLLAVCGYLGNINKRTEF